MGFLCGSSPINTGWVGNFVKQMQARIQSLITKLQTYVQKVRDLANQAIAAGQSALASIQSAIQSVFAKMQSVLDAAMAHIHDMISSAFSSIQHAFTCSNEQQAKIAVQSAAVSHDPYATVLKSQVTLAPQANLPTTTSDLLSQGGTAISDAVGAAALTVLTAFSDAFGKIASVFSTSITLPSFSLTFPAIA